MAGEGRGRDAPWAVRVYRGLAGVALPGWFRRRWAEEMTRAFADEWADTTRTARRVRLAARSAWGLVRTGAAVRWRDRRGRGAEDGGRTGIAGSTGGGRVGGDRGVGGTLVDGAREAGRVARSLARRPSFSVPVVAALGLGLGAATTVFSIVDGAALRPLPYPDADELVWFWTRFERNGDDRFMVSVAEFLDLRDETRVLGSLGAWGDDRQTLTGDGPARRVDAVWASASLFEVLGIRPAAGRMPTPADDAPGAAPVAVVSRAFAAEALGGPEGAPGRRLVLDGATVEVVGVLPAEATLPGRAATPDVIRPMAVDRAAITDRSGHGLRMVGRLREGRDVADLERELGRIHAGWAERFAGEHTPGADGHTFETGDLDGEVRGDARRTAGLLLASVTLLLLLACVNAAGLLLARGEERAGETAVRRALGAGRAGLVRRVLLESGLLALAGAVLGAVLARAAGDALLSLHPGLARVATSPDARVLGFTAAATVVAALAFGSLPALRTGEGAPAARPGPGGPDRRGVRGLRLLVGAQVAVSVVVLGLAGLFVRSLVASAAVDPGFAAQERWSFSVSASAAAGYEGAGEVRGFRAALVEAVGRVTGVRDAALVRDVPLGSPVRMEGVVPGDGDHRDPSAAMPVALQAVGPGYFRVMGVPLVEGRTIGAGDDAGAARVALVSGAAARAYWPGRSPVGARVRALFGSPDDPPYTVVGVVGDVRHEGPDTEPLPTLYIPLDQLPSRAADWGRSVSVVLHAPRAPADLGARVRGAVAGVAPSVPPEGFGSLTALVDDALGPRRFLAVVLSLFGGISLLIAAVGLHGAVAFNVRRRRREMGVRLALGAEPSGLVRRVLAESLAVTAAGVGVGLGGVLLLAPSVRAWLYGVGPTDPLSLAAAPVVLLSTAVVAALTPALRAGRTDPVGSLRG